MAPPDDLAITIISVPSPDSKKHEGPFNQAALGAILPGPVHAQGRIKDLLTHGDIKNLSQYFEGSCGTIDIILPIIHGNPLLNKLFVIHSPVILCATRSRTLSCHQKNGLQEAVFLVYNCNDCYSDKTTKPVFAALPRLFAVPQRWQNRPDARHPPPSDSNPRRHR